MAHDGELQPQQEILSNGPQPIGAPVPNRTQSASAFGAALANPAVLALAELLADQGHREGRDRPSDDPKPDPAREHSLLLPAAVEARAPLGHLASAAIALLAGMIGAWGFHHFFSGQAESSNASAGRSSRLVEASALKPQVDSLAEQIDACKKRLDEMPKPEPHPDFAALESKLTELSMIVQNVVPLPQDLKQLGDRVRDLDKSLQNYHSEVVALKQKNPSKQPSNTAEAEKRGPPRAASASVNVLEQTLIQGADLFKQGKYGEARGIFSKLEQANPDDPRVWYYAALCNGLITGKWDGESERLVEQGVEHERAGTHKTAQIDASFASLTSATGKDWLTAYRQRVALR